MSLVASPSSLLHSPPTVHYASQSPMPSPTGSHRTSPFEKNVQGLLVPTDRSREDVEEKWLPRLGRLRIDREVVLEGYSLYLLRSWFLSRTHWSQTIVTHTGKPTEHITAYVLVADPELSPNVGRLELDTATQLLASETRSQPRKTDHGTLLITTPSAFGQDVSSLAAGDLRVARPYLTLATGLRRLGCGGRAAIGMEFPVPAIRRKFHDLYRIPAPVHTNISQAPSPTNSPVGPAGSPQAPSPGLHIEAEPFYLSVIELIKLIQASLALWGLFGADRHDLEINGLFCDETKAGMFEWRRLMGMDTEDSLKLEKETSGGCIDPRTLAALLSSITSVHYQLEALGVERVPKDPFTHVHRFLSAWDSYQIVYGRAHSKSHYLSVASIRYLRQQYINERTNRSIGSDALKAPRAFLSGVAHATTNFANLRSVHDDIPLHKREHHLRFKHSADASHNHGHDHGNGADASPIGSGGVALITSDVGHVAPPDVITTDLDAYSRGLHKTKDKDLAILGARRVADLWSGHFIEEGAKKRHKLEKVFHKQRQASRLVSEDDGETSGGGPRGALKGIGNRTGQAIKGVSNFVGRRGGDTSDSEGGPGPSSMRNMLSKSRQNTVPTVIEPDVEEVDEQLHYADRSPSPLSGRGNGWHEHQTNGSLRHSLLTTNNTLTATSRPASHRPSLITAFSNDSADHLSRRSWVPNTNGDHLSAIDGNWGDPSSSSSRPGMADRAMMWRSRGRATAMLRTSSDGADVAVEENGLEWEVLNPHGTSKGQHPAVMDPEERALLRRRNSLQNDADYENVRVTSPEHLQVDVDMCGLVWDLRERERLLARKARDFKTLEDTVFKASQDVITAIHARNDRLQELMAKHREAELSIRDTLRGLDEDENLRDAGGRIDYNLSGDPGTHEVMLNLRQLRMVWRKAQQGMEMRRKEMLGDADVPDPSANGAANGNGNGNGNGVGEGHESSGADGEVKQEGKKWWRLGF